jgi:hypothetical protein
MRICSPWVAPSARTSARVRLVVYCLRACPAVVPEVHDCFLDLAGRGPLSGRITGSRLRNLKELRPGSAGRTEIRVLYIFAPQRQVVLLVAGDKAAAGPAGTTKRS